MTLFSEINMDLPWDACGRESFAFRSLTSANNCFGKVSPTDGKILPKEIRGRHPDFSTIVVECWMLGATSVVRLKFFS